MINTTALPFVVTRRCEEDMRIGYGTKELSLKNADCENKDRERGH